MKYALLLVAFLTTCVIGPQQPMPQPVTRVEISPTVLNNWAWAWHFWTATEWAFCLQTRRDSSTLHIESESLALITKAGISRIWFNCPRGTGGSAHSHRMFDGQTYCSFSDEDLVRQVFEPEIVVVVCSDSAFVFRLPNWPRDSLVGGRMHPVFKLP